MKNGIPVNSYKIQPMNYKLESSITKLFIQLLCYFIMPPISKKTLVLGASDNPSRYSYLAVNKLREHNHPVVAIGKTTAMVADVPVQSDTSPYRIWIQLRCT